MLANVFQHFKHLKEANKLSRFALEIALIVIVKAALIWLLWSFCFSAPIAKDARQLAVTKLILNHSN